MLAKQTLTLVVLSHNELDELRVLLSWLSQRATSFDELLIIDDFSDDETNDLLASYDCGVYKRKLNGDFASQRNFGLEKATGDFVFFIDADEVPANGLLLNLRRLIAYMQSENYDVCAIPRLNVVYDGDEFLDCTEMKFSERDLVEQLPDDQVRVMRKTDRIRYKYAVHEKLVGARKGLRLPPRLELCLLHVKRSRRQVGQNDLYSSLERLSLRATVRAILQRIGLRNVAKTVRGWYGPRWSTFNGDFGTE